MHTSLPTVFTREQDRHDQPHLSNWRHHVREEWYNTRDPDAKHPNDGGVVFIYASDYFTPSGTYLGDDSEGWGVRLTKHTPSGRVHLTPPETMDYFYGWTRTDIEAGWLVDDVAYFQVDGDWYRCTLTPIGQYDGDGVYLIEQFAIDPNFVPPERGPIAWADTTLLHCSHGWETVHV